MAMGFLPGLPTARPRASHPASLRTRLTLRWTLAFGLVLTVALGLVYVSARAFGARALDLHLRTVAATELASSSDQGAALHLHEFPVGALNDQEFAPKFSLIYDLQGVLVAHTGGIEPGDISFDQAFRARALAGESPLIDVDWQGRRGRLIALRAEDPDGTPYILAVGMLADRLDAGLRRLQWLLLGVWVAALAATSIVGHHLASRALQPIDQITRRAREIANDRIEARLDPPESDDEIGRMTRLLNEMLDRLHAVIDANRRFAADASHELRSPLTAIAGEVDVALKRERSAADYAETLRVVRERVSGMFALADDLTLLVQAEERADAVALRPVDVASLLGEVLAHLTPLAAERGVELAGLPAISAGLRVFGDAALLARAIDNVVRNAVLYTPPGGEVHLEVTWLPPPERDTWTSGHVRILVRDTGPGVPREAREKIFERFHRLDASRSRRTGGTGLGLPIARAIVTLFGGTVRVVGTAVQSSVFSPQSSVLSPQSSVFSPQSSVPGASVLPPSAAPVSSSSGPGATFEIVLPGERT